MRFSCPTCSQLMEAPDTEAGKKAICPKCNQKVLVPTPPPSPLNVTVLGKLEDAATGVSPIPVATFADPPQPMSAGRRLTFIGLASLVASFCIGFCGTMPLTAWTFYCNTVNRVPDARTTEFLTFLEKIARPLMGLGMIASIVVMVIGSYSASREEKAAKEKDNAVPRNPPG